MQPLISYGLRASVSFRATNYIARSRCEDYQDIVFSPRTEVAPPVTIEDFPGEYQLNATGSIRRRLSRCLLGILKMSTKEPSPLFSTPQRRNGQALGRLELNLKTPNPLLIDQYSRWSCKIRLEIVRTIYYSTMPLTGVASDCLISENGYVRKRNEVVHSHQWTVNPLCWNKPSSTNELTASIPLTIEPPSQLIPTFSMPLVTVRYSCKARLQILQVSHSTLEVEAPLQVHNKPWAASFSTRENVSRSGRGELVANLIDSEVRLAPLCGIS